MGICLCREVGEREGALATPDMVSPQSYYSGIVRLSNSFRGTHTPPGIAMLLESPRISSMALDSPRLSVASWDFVFSPRISSDLADAGLNDLFRKRGKVKAMAAAKHRTIYSGELTSSQRLAAKKILQDDGRGGKSHCICCKDCGSRKIARCRDCGSDKLAKCRMCGHRVARCGECRFGKPLNCSACASTHLSSSQQIESAKINCGSCRALMLTSCELCATRFRRGTCGSCGRASADAESREELEELSELGLDHSMEDSSVEFREMSSGVFEMRKTKKKKKKKKKKAQLGQQRSFPVPVAVPAGLSQKREFAQVEVDKEDGEDLWSDSMNSGTGNNTGQEEVGQMQAFSVEGASSTDGGHVPIHARNISFGKYVPEVSRDSGFDSPHLMQILQGDVSFSSYLPGPECAQVQVGGSYYEGLDLEELSQQFENLAKTYSEAAAMAAVSREMRGLREDNDASLTFPKLSLAEGEGGWNVPFLSLEPEVSASADYPSRTTRAAVSNGSVAAKTKAETMKLMEAMEGKASKVETAAGAGGGGAAVAEEEEDRSSSSKIMDGMEEKFIKAQLHTHGFLLDSLSKEEFADQLRVRHAALRSKLGGTNASESGPMAGFAEKISRNLHRMSAYYTRSSQKESTATAEVVKKGSSGGKWKGKKEKAGAGRVGPVRLLSSKRVAPSSRNEEIQSDTSLDEDEKPVKASQNHINMSEIIEALRVSSSKALSDAAPTKHKPPSLKKDVPEQPIAPKKEKSVSWGDVVKEPRSRSFEETRSAYPVFADSRRRHSLESGRKTCLSDADLKSILKTKSVPAPVPPASSVPAPSAHLWYPTFRKSGRVPLTFSSPIVIPPAPPAKPRVSFSSESFKYESLAAFSMIHDYDSDVSASRAAPRPKVASVKLLDCGHVARCACKGADAKGPAFPAIPPKQVSAAAEKMSAMGVESASLKALGSLGAGIEEEMENFLGASPGRRKRVRKAEVQRKLNQIASISHLAKQRGDASAYNDSPASSWAEEVEKYVVASVESGDKESVVTYSMDELLPPWLMMMRPGSAFGSPLGLPLDPVAPCAADKDDLFAPRGCRDRERRKSFGDRAAAPAPQKRRSIHGTISYELPTFYPSARGGKGEQAGGRSFSGRYTLSVFDSSRSSFEADRDFARPDLGNKTRKKKHGERQDKLNETDDDGDSSADLFEIDSIAATSTAMSPMDMEGEKKNTVCCTPPEVIDVSLFEEFAKPAADSPMSLTVSLNSMDCFNGSDLSISFNFSEDDMDDSLVFPRQHRAPDMAFDYYQNDNASSSSMRSSLGGHTSFQRYGGNKQRHNEWAHSPPANYSTFPAAQECAVEEEKHAQKANRDNNSSQKDTLARLGISRTSTHSSPSEWSTLSLGSAWNPDVSKPGIETSSDLIAEAREHVVRGRPARPHHFFAHR